MKGQYLTIEYVIFFAIGIAMIVGVYLTFSGINDNLREDSMIMQLEKTNELIRDAIVNVYEAGTRTESKIQYKLSIPTTLSGKTYAVRYSNGNINTNSTENFKIGSVLNVYNININSPSIIYSTNGKINIYYEDNGVSLS